MRRKGEMKANARARSVRNKKNEEKLLKKEKNEEIDRKTAGRREEQQQQQQRWLTGKNKVGERRSYRKKERR